MQDSNVKYAFDWAERVAVALISLPFVIAFLRSFNTHPQFILLAISELFVVVFVLARRHGDMPMKLYPVVIAFAGTALPLFVRPAETISIVPSVVSSTAMLAGLLLNVFAKVFLNRSFGIIAANRGVKRGGPYRFVRHPMYLGYITTQFGFLLAAFSWYNFGVYAVAWLAQLLRIREEESVLSLDESYRTYSERVPYRLIPGLL